MAWLVPLSPQQLIYAQGIIDDAQDVEYEEEDVPATWPYVTATALIVHDQQGLFILRDDLLRAIDEWEKGRRKKMVENIVDHIDVATSREIAIPAGQTVEIGEMRGGRMRYYSIIGPWPARWPK